MTTQPPGGWLTIRQAATALNVSELTVRRRIKDNKVAHRLEGGKYYVNLELPVPDPAPPRGSTSAPGTAHVVDPEDVTDVPVGPGEHLELLVPELTRLATEAGRAQQLETQVAALQTRCDELQRELLALAGRNGWLESQVQEREREVLQLADSGKRRGWRRLFG